MCGGRLLFYSRYAGGILYLQPPGADADDDGEDEEDEEYAPAREGHDWLGGGFSHVPCRFPERLISLHGWWLSSLDVCQMLTSSG